MYAGLRQELGADGMNVLGKSVRIIAQRGKIAQERIQLTDREGRPRLGRRQTRDDFVVAFKGSPTPRFQELLSQVVANGRALPLYPTDHCVP